MSKKIADGIRDKAGIWKHGHTYQAHPVSCAASLAVQKAVVEENLLENCRAQGNYLESLLRRRLGSPNALAAPFVFDIRGGGGFWGLEFDFTGPEAQRINFQGKQFGMLVQARCLENGLIIMGEPAIALYLIGLAKMGTLEGFHGGSNVEGTEGDHFLICPPYNVKKTEVEQVVEIFVTSVEAILQEFTVSL